jgi:hypothetical protein
MKNSILGFASLAIFVAFRVNASVIAGPITNPANGHEYYLLSPNTWTASETEAEHLGGTLAVIKNAGDQEWVFSTFGNYGGTNRNLWIGLHRVGAERRLAWPMAEKLDFANWAGGQPDGSADCVVMASSKQPFGFAAGAWDDFPDNGEIDGLSPNGVVEVPGKSKEKALSATEKDFRGAWYAAGKADCPCFVASTDHELFIINESNWASRAIVTREHRLFVASWRIYGEMLQDRILWSNGTWWSRHPVSSETAEFAIKPEDLKRAAGEKFELPDPVR